MERRGEERRKDRGKALKGKLKQRIAALTRWIVTTITVVRVGSISIWLSRPLWLLLLLLLARLTIVVVAEERLDEEGGSFAHSQPMNSVEAEVVMN